MKTLIIFSHVIIAPNRQNIRLMLIKPTPEYDWQNNLTH